MKAAFITKHAVLGKVGEELQIGKLPLPEPKPGEVLVRIHASTLNIDDLHMAQGSFAGGIRILQTRSPTEEKPLLLGSDFAGVVERVGSQVKGFEVGSRVCGLQLRPFGHMGTWSTHTVAPKSNLVRIPEGCSYENAVALVMPLFVGLAIVKKAKLEPEARVLVIGASGGIGSVLLQLLRAETNIHVTGVCSGRNAEFVERVGADHVVDYTKGPVQEQLQAEQKFDVVVDLLGGADSYDTGRAVLKARSGRFITATGPIAWLGERKLGLGELCKATGSIIVRSIANLFPGTHPYYHLVTPGHLKPDALEKAIGAGVTAKITDSIKLEKKALVPAIRTVQQHKVTGKIVITMPVS